MMELCHSCFAAADEALQRVGLWPTVSSKQVSVGCRLPVRAVLTPQLFLSFLATIWPLDMPRPSVTPASGLSCSIDETGRNARGERGNSECLI